MGGFTVGMTNDELIAWLEGQAVWVKDATLTYYENGGFTEQDIKRFGTESIEETSGVRRDIDISNLNILTRDNRSNFSIKSIDNVIGVNALAAGKSLTFGEQGVTIVYGENGAGKSGYIRILKKLADAKYKEELKKNVYTTNKGEQSCNISIIHEGVEENLACNLSKDGEYSLLKDIDIFDTKISKAYVEAAKEASYEPWVFSMLSAIAKVAPEVKSIIEDEKDKLDDVEIVIPDELEETEVCKAISSITEKTKFDDTFFCWDKELGEELAKKEKDSNVEAIRASIINLKKEIEHLEAIRRYIAQFEEFFSKKNIDEILDVKGQLESAKEEQVAAQLLFENTAGDLDKRSVKNQAWINLWKSAKQYYDTFLMSENIAKYTDEKGICPLCGQDISGEKNIHRMQSVDEYVNGRASEKVTDKRSALIRLLKKCPKAWGSEQYELAIASAGIKNIEDDVKEAAMKILAASDSIYSDEADRTEVPEIDIGSLLKLIDNSIKEKNAERQNQSDLLGDDEHQKLIEEINALKAQKYVSGIRDKVASRISYLKQVSLFNKAEKLTATNKISSQSTALAKELLTDDYEKRFNDELRLLTRGSVRAVIRQQRASRGKIPFKVELEGVEDKSASPSDVLSEGENRVVSLAAFFAESSGRNAQCPLIVDDPISSLDNKYESSVIHRLVEAGKHRQVIVFTHRLSMVVGLYDECGKEVPFEEVEILGRGKNKGVPVESAVNGGKSLGKLKNLKNDNLAKLKKLDENSFEYIEGIHYVCQQIRIHVEKSIEDTLLNGIVLRYRKSVQTQGKIMWLSKINQDDCEIIDEMMTKYSYYDHSMSDELPLQEFTLEEIEQDVDRLIAWLTDITARMKSK
jgi:hypothetical protein